MAEEMETKGTSRKRVATARWKRILSKEADE